MNARLSLLVAAVAALFVGIPAGRAQKTSGLTREKGAIYIEDFVKDPVKLRVNEDSTCYSDLTGQRPLGTIAAGQLATLVAFTEKACRVRARAMHGDVVAWIATASLEAKDPAMFDKLKKVAERQKQVGDLIAHKEIAIGMTPDEVIQALGKPDTQSAHLDKNSRTGTFDYITYDKVPQRTLGHDVQGRVYETITYIKVESGRFTVSFENGTVTAIESTKGKPSQGGGRIVVPPIEIW